MENQTTNNRDLVTAVSGPAGERQVRLSEPQRLALEWLMSGGSGVDAAEVAGVCRQTVSRWINTDADFRAVLDAWRQQQAAITQSRIAALGDPAVEILAEAIRERRDVKASQFVIRQLVSGNKCW